MTERYIWKAVHSAAFLFISGLFSAASAQVAISPIRVDLGDDNDKDVILVTSQAATTRSYEVEVVAWTQTDDRREIYSPTEEILAVPPLFTLEPGDEQVVRIGMMSESDPSVEKSYRMFITELAPPQEEARESTGVNMRLRLGIPVFVAPKALPYATLDHTGSKQVDQQLFMRLENSGNTHVRISEIRYLAPGTEKPEVESVAIYILAGQAGYVPVSLPGDRPVGTVAVVTDTLGTVEYDLSASM